MDMQTGLAYSEDYSANSASIWAYARASGWRPRPVGYAGPVTLCNYIQSVEKAGTRGAEFAYKTVNTDVMTWVMERVTGLPFSRLLQDRIWAPLGCQKDGYIIVDAAGMAMTGAGLSAVVSEKNPRQVSGRNAALANRAGSDEADGPAESRQNSLPPKNRIYAHAN